MSCIEDWRSDLRQVSASSARRNALPLIDISCLPGPPEVRVVRLSLGTRPQESRPSVPDLSRAYRPPPQGPDLSPVRLRPRRSKKKKKPQMTQTTIEIDNNKLPLSVTLGRALGAQVQPLMAILMSPRVRTSSLDSDCSGDDSPSDGEDSLTKVKAPLLTITSLELPDLAQSRPVRQPVRRVRTSIRRSKPAPVTTATAQYLACAGLALPRP